MKIRIIWAGKCKEHFVKEGISKYLNLLSPFCKLEIIEIKESKGKDIIRSLRKDGEKIINASSGYVLLDEGGREMTSIQLSDYLLKSGDRDFVIGGAYGVSEEVTENASDVLSLSRLTFTHDMARLILLEQIYRAFTIINRRGYHH
ncbi:ribosomal RNA large subunit methyltransferase H [bacterium BMS3Abin07]|nr:ribosomal RNA large subunit methyltransferase H [bacterium BMS3Abin07]GBE32896.1 ribosomal RNA large subunit methyltransferase H [bacterium BMS3Bbin05]HDO23202.1 23S rRNA (pseudouridine(1915)-N(3))-methyltransferase RlmH [Nitrospirota bacterium]HDZ87097.1 23S rRNA (pseudouridine(1915)-N(3))-methyltransferase RlmH [Nitrospirota bacterium]